MWHTPYSSLSLFKVNSAIDLEEHKYQFFLALYEQILSLKVTFVPFFVNSSERAQAIYFCPVRDYPKNPNETVWLRNLLPTNMKKVNIE